MITKAEFFLTTEKGQKMTRSAILTMEKDLIVTNDGTHIIGETLLIVNSEFGGAKKATFLLVEEIGGIEIFECIYIK